MSSVAMVVGFGQLLSAEPPMPGGGPPMPGGGPPTPGGGPPKPGGGPPTPGGGPPNPGGGPPTPNGGPPTPGGASAGRPGGGPDEVSSACLFRILDWDPEMAKTVTLRAMSTVRDIFVKVTKPLR